MTQLADAPSARLSRVEWAMLLVALAAAAVHFQHSSLEASVPKYIPDAVEYAVAAQRLATLGRFDLALAGASYPSRYGPWFSLLLAPAYWLAPHDLGAGIWIVCGFALLAVAAAFFIGRAIAGDAGACCAVSALLLQPGLADFASAIMTDMPAAALGLSALALLLCRRHATGTFVCVGLLLAGAFALRPTSLAFALPAVAVAMQREPRRRIAALLALAVPLLAVQFASWSYQYRVFGDAARSGYQFWCPVPYDYPSLVWSLGYLKTNAAALTHPRLFVPGLIGLAGASVLALRRPAGWRLPVLFMWLVALPIALFHLGYFYTQARFWLPLVCLCGTIGAAGLASALPRSRWLAPAVLLGCTGFVVTQRLAAAPAQTIVPELAAALQRVLPTNALIISDLDAVYLEPNVLRGSARELLPATRDAEYASKLIARHKLGALVPPPRDATDHRALGLRRAGAEEVFAKTADEALDAIADGVAAGRPTYAALSSSPANDALLRALAARVRLVPLREAPLILQLLPVRH